MIVAWGIRAGSPDSCVDRGVAPPPDNCVQEFRSLSARPCKIQARSWTAVEYTVREPSQCMRLSTTSTYQMSIVHVAGSSKNVAVR